jgi:antitoxin PrlF
MKTRVSEKGQVTIPKAARDKLGLRPGTTLEVTAEEGRLVAVKIVEQDPIDALYGIIKTTETTDEFMEAIRGDREIP